MADSNVQPKPRLPLGILITALVGAPVLAVVGASLLAVDLRLSGESGRASRAQLDRVSPVVGQELVVEGERLERLGTVIARDPKFFAVLTLPKADQKSSEFRSALENVLRDFQQAARTPLFAVTGDDGALLGRASAPALGAVDLSAAPFVRAALAGRQGLGYVVENGNTYRVAAVPVTAGATTVGVLCLGTPLDASLAERVEIATGCDVTFLADRKVASSSIPASPLRKFVAERAEDWSRLDAPVPEEGSQAPDEWTTGGRDYLAVGAKLDGPSVGGDAAFVLLLRSGAGTAYEVLRRDMVQAGGAGLALALAAGALIAVAVTRRRRVLEATHAREVQRLEETDRMRSGFLSTAAREVLAPTEKIRTCVELITDGALGDLSEPQREGLVAIRRSAEEVARTGSDLANMSLIDRRELPVVLDQGDVGRLVEEVAIRVAPLAGERRQRVAITVESALEHPRVDVECLAQAVLNLAVNAARHTPEGGSVDLGARRTDRAIEIFVTDTGTGISDEDRARIEERRIAGQDPTSGYHASTYRSPGLGLGLSVAFGIVEAHGGGIRLDSETEQGSVFTIELPLPDAPRSVLPAVTGPVTTDPQALPLAS
jgi:signal transduction histidine kinase